MVLLLLLVGYFQKDAPDLLKITERNKHYYQVSWYDMSMVANNMVQSVGGSVLGDPIKLSSLDTR